MPVDHHLQMVLLELCREVILGSQIEILRQILSLINDLALSLVGKVFEIKILSCSENRISKFNIRSIV